MSTLNGEAEPVKVLTVTIESPECDNESWPDMLSRLTDENTELRYHLRRLQEQYYESLKENTRLRDVTAKAAAAIKKTLDMLEEHGH